MNDSKASTRAVENLNFALKGNRIDMVTYRHEKEQIEKRINSIYDDCLTKSKSK